MLPAEERKSWGLRALLYGGLYAALLLLLPERGCVGDYHFWTVWAGTIRQEGLGMIYYSSANYNPFFYYFLYLFDLLQPVAEELRQNIYQLKALVLPFDFLGALLAATLLPKTVKHRWLYPLLLLLNPAYLYNTYIWGQIDAIVTAFVLLAVVLALKNHPVSCLAAFALALCTKLQAVIFLPLLGLLLVPAWRLAPRSSWQGVAAFLAVVLVVFIPHALGTGEVAWRRLGYINFGAVDYYPLISLNAYNLWTLALPGVALNTTPDTLQLGMLPVKHWGLLGFCSCAALLLLPVALRSAVRLLNGEQFKQEDWNVVLLAAGLLPLAFCFLNTQMHERYWHPALLLLAAYAFRSRDFGPVALVSVAYFLNLEGVLQALEFGDYQAFFWQPRVAASLFGLALAWGVVQLYRQQGTWQLARHLWKGEAMKLGSSSKRAPV